MAEENKQAAKPAKKTARAATPPRAEQRCTTEGCKRPYRAKGLCVTHYKLWRRGEHGKKQRYKTCSKEGCRKPMGRFGVCAEHAKGGEAAPAAS